MLPSQQLRYGRLANTEDLGKGSLRKPALSTRATEGNRQRMRIPAVSRPLASAHEVNKIEWKRIIKARRMQAQTSGRPRSVATIPADPEAELMPGVRWGRPEWVPSAAFWAFMVGRASEPVDGFVGREVSLAHEIGFCLLGGYGITAEVNHAVHRALAADGIFEPGRSPGADEIEALLRRPVRIGERSVRYRFPKQRAARLADALTLIETDPPPSSDALAFRRHLMRLPGVGPKTASWVTRNWLGSDEVAILDIHIIRAGLLIGLFERPIRLPRDYEALERRFLQFCVALDAKPSLVDAVMWRAMRNIGRGPV
jgi:N-glycosylase/DNA lyase